MIEVTEEIENKTSPQVFDRKKYLVSQTRYFLQLNLFYDNSGLIKKIFELCIFMMLIFFSKNNSFKSRSDNRSSTIKAGLIGTVHRSSLYTESFSCSPHYRIHLSMDFIFVWPVVMLWSVFSCKMITAIYVSTWSSIVSSRYNSPIFHNNCTGSSWNTFWSFRNFICNTQEIFISKHERNNNKLYLYSKDIYTSIKF